MQRLAGATRISSLHLPLISLVSRQFSCRAHFPTPALQLKLTPTVQPITTPIGTGRLTMTSRAVSSSPSTLTLTAQETRLFRGIMAMCADQKLGTTVRVAGGWVRDKLLGLESHDIDLALDDMTGVDFANLLDAHYNAQHAAERGEQGERLRTHPVTIRSNPEQSKHLETATLVLEGVELDLTNLRTEVYPEGSRIPKMVKATALEDATRRDFTVNALFYNLNTGQVEDLCGSGLADLQAGLIRTPLSPTVTFREDPLRVLRAARFAGNLGYAVHPDISHAAALQTTRHDLLTKVSRERMGIEVWKMCCKNQSGVALSLLCRWGLRPAVFWLTPDVRVVHVDLPWRGGETGTEHERFVEQLHVLELTESEYLEHPQLTMEMERAAVAAERVLLALPATHAFNEAHSHAVFMLAAFLSPLAGVSAVQGSKQRPLPHALLRDGLKLSKRQCEHVASVAFGAKQLAWLARELHHEQHPPNSNSTHTTHTTTSTNTATTGAQPSSSPSSSSSSFSSLSPLETLQLRCGHTLHSLKDLWPLAMHLCRVLPRSPLDTADSTVDPTADDPTADDDRWILACDALEAFLSSRLLLDNGGCWAWKPLLDGHEAAKLLQVKGKAVGQALLQMRDWQLLHPHGTKAECQRWLVAQPRVVPVQAKKPKQKQKRKNTAPKANSEQTRPDKDHSQPKRHKR